MAATDGALLRPDRRAARDAFATRRLAHGGTDRAARGAGAAAPAPEAA